MKNSWLESKTMFALFSCSAWAVVCWGIVIVFGLIFWGQQTKSFQTYNPIDVILGGAFVVVSIFAFLIIIFGMAIFCVRRDRSSVGIKILWFLFFFFTAPFGPTVYFFTVYRKQRAANHEALNG
jgi:ABC-type transport system involved in multi-copper enzyme maturation permease subunit